MAKTIRFRCDCGASLRAPLSAAGRTGTCRRCSTRVTIPVLAESAKEAEHIASSFHLIQGATSHGTATDYSRWPLRGNARGGGNDSASQESKGALTPPSLRATTDVSNPPRHPHVNRSHGVPSAANATSEVASQLCSICQTEIEAGEPSTTCDECHLPFHIECWEENLGCSAYGCPNVNALRVRPDIQINSPPPLPTRFPAHAGNNSVPAQGGIPWEYLLLAASAMGTLLGLLCFGVLALFAGAAAVLYFVASRQDQATAVLVASLAISVIGFIAGLVLSVSFWW